MPQLIEHPETLAIRKQRDVLFVDFPELWMSEYDWETYSRRDRLIKFLDSQGIGWSPCAPPRSKNGTLIEGYMGDIYLDVPFDSGNAHYQMLQHRLEFPDGTLRDPKVRFRLMDLTTALQIQERIDREGKKPMD